MLTMNSCISKTDDVPWRIVEAEAILVNLNEGEIIHLNPAGTAIWNLINGKKTVKEIIEHIYEQFEVDKETAKKDTLDFLTKLIKKSVAEECSSIP